MFLPVRQAVRLAADFENEGGFSERMYKHRTDKRQK
jgi:four helix bundle suffix protein